MKYSAILIKNNVTISSDMPVLVELPEVPVALADSRMLKIFSRHLAIFLAVILAASEDLAAAAADKEEDG